MRLETSEGGFVADVAAPHRYRVALWGERLFLHEAGDVWREVRPLVVREVRQ